ncbi:MAG: hypothetical protein AABZ77_08505 [Chloroflexota bacterium]
MFEFDLREVSWPVAIGRAVISVILLTGALVAINIFIYLGATNSTFNERIAAAFRDSYDYGYAQTFDATYKKALTNGFDKGYSKGYEISQESNSTKPVSRLVQTHNPTYSELTAFLAADKTDSNTYVDGHYVCFDYAADVNNKADAAGIQAAYVRLRSTDWGHAVVAFDTVDRGLVYIEPQSDQEVKLVLGQPYPWRQVGATSPLSASDPIIQIELIW